MSDQSVSAFEALKRYLIQNHNAKAASGGKEITKKCHICGDSRDPSSRHMYIGMKGGVIVYNCFKCNSSGVVDNKFLRDLDCADFDLMRLCNQNNMNNTRYLRNEQMEAFSRYSRPNITFHRSPGNDKKVESICRRMGYDFFKEGAIQSFKIIVNLKEFLIDNGIKEFTRDPFIIDELSNFYIGFLSMDNKYVNLRRLVPEDKVHPSIRSRYVKYNIFNLDKSDYYTIPGTISPQNPEIHIAEGPFDIVGVKLIADNDYGNRMYSAIGGKSYLGIVKYLLSRFGFICFTLHIYADSDIDTYEIQKISDYIRIYQNPVYLHRNTMDGEKDFGVAKSRIIDSIIKV